MSNDIYVSVHSDLSEIYSTDSDRTRERYVKIKATFEQQFGAPPDLYARSPGRVNLIGEHIDYEGYSVLPMAIAHDTVVAIRKHGNHLIVSNTDSGRYETQQFSTDPSQSVDAECNAWTNYVIAAYKGVYEYMETAGISHSYESGLEILVDGEVPAGSGLSSSSALVCATALAVLAIQDVLDQVTKSQLAHLTCVCERYSGTESGGMDQAISIMARPGFAKLIKFDPVRGIDVSLPKSGVFVIANSLAESKKSETADKRFNLRVFECHAAALILGFFIGLTEEQNLEIEILRHIEEIADLEDRAKAVLQNTSLSGTYHSRRALCIALVRRCLAKQNYYLSEVEEYLDFGLECVFEKSPNGMRVLRMLQADASECLQLHDRALHVYSESQRVMDMKAICDESEMEEEEKLKKIGTLMNASHASCRDLYECSSPELEQLVSICNAFGAIGSRLTGAGWGGCVVALIHEKQCDQFIENVKEAFYMPRVKSGKLLQKDVSTHIFASKPSSGAAVFKLE